jgi:6-phosphogluconolactonase
MTAGRSPSAVELRWVFLQDAEAVAEYAVRCILEAAARAIAGHGRFRIVLAGGQTPCQTYQRLVQAKTGWSAWEIYFGDERCLPADHPERNSRMATEAWLSRVPVPQANVHPIPAELGPLPAARLYASIIEHLLPFDLVLLGIGEDGHTASLFPGHQHSPDELVHPVFEAPKPPRERVTLSARALGNTREALVLATGGGKQEALQAWRAGRPLPIADIHPLSGLTVCADQAAARLLLRPQDRSATLEQLPFT